MKKLLILSIFTIASVVAIAQDFKKDLAAAKSSYNVGKLEDAHFKIEQMLQELDITIGKEVLKMLPEKMGNMQAITSEDNVTGNIGYLGATIQRNYKTGDKKAELQIVNNSPMIGTLNALFNMPMMGAMGGDGKTKVIKVQGYKSRLTKNDDTDAGTTSYRLEIPLSNALVSIDAANTSENAMIAMANSLPLEKIAKLIE